MHLLYYSLSFYIYSLFLYFLMFLPLCQVIPYLFFVQFLLLFFEPTVIFAFHISSLYHQFDPIYTKYCLPLKSIELFRNLHGNCMKLPFSAKGNGPKNILCVPNSIHWIFSDFKAIIPDFHQCNQAWRLVQHFRRGSDLLQITKK